MTGAARQAAACATAIFAALAAGCALGPVDLSDKECPCAPGWICDPSTSRCVPAGGGDGGRPPGAILVSNLHVVWTTPNQIRWEWVSAGPADQLQDYELVTGTSEADVISRTGSAVVWTRNQNPELGRFLLPRTDGEDPVVATVTDLHEPDTLIHGQLTAVDTAGRWTVSNLAAGWTAIDALAAIVVFSEAEPPGYSLPDTFAWTGGAAYQGTYALQWIAECPPVEPLRCWQNLRRQGMALDLAAISGGGYLTTAFLELALASDATVPSWWSEMSVWYVANQDLAIGPTSYSPFTARPDGSYRVLQVPLRAFLRDGAPEDYPVIQSGLFGVRVGGEWDAPSTVRVDEIRIRW